MQTTEDTKLATFQAGLAALAEGDFDAMGGVFHHDIEWRWAGKSRVAGTHSGRDEVTAMLASIREATGGTLRLEPIDILVGDDYLTVFQRMSAEREGADLELTRCDVIRFEDGLIREFWSLVNDQDAFDTAVA